MDETASRFWQELLTRTQGPMHFRFLLQPAMAALLAIRDGRRDAKNGRPAYLWAAITQPEHRRELLHSAWKSIGKIIVLALTLDLIYQLVATKTVRPLEAVVIAFILAVIPYVLLRGPINRLLN